MRNTEKAFLWITSILEQHGIAYKIIGGFAARLYGVNRELADIDFEITDSDILEVKKYVEPYIIFGPERYLDENWDLEMMTLEYEGQEIDICGAGAKLYNFKTGVWEGRFDNFPKNTLAEIYGKLVPLEPLGLLIDYKSKLAREVDLEDIRQLSEKQNI